MDASLMLEVPRILASSLTDIVSNVYIRCEKLHHLFESAKTSANSKRMFNLGLYKILKTISTFRSQYDRA